MEFLGYGRVSTREQDLTGQVETLRTAGCERIFSEKITGRHAQRPELEKMLDYARKEDVVVVTRLDRLARNTRDLLDIAEHLLTKGVGLKSLAEPWADTTSPAGKMILTVLAGVAEFERSVIVARTSAGRCAAKARGVKFGRPRKSDESQIALIQAGIEKGMSVEDLTKSLSISKATIYRRLREIRQRKARNF